MSKKQVTRYNKEKSLTGMASKNFRYLRKRGVSRPNAYKMAKGSKTKWKK